MIECTIDGHVALVTLNNPSANTFTAEGLLQLTKLIGDLNANLEVYAAAQGLPGPQERLHSLLR